MGYWDIHNHILPGIDDGSPALEESLEMLNAEYAQGIRNIIFTPHYRPGMFPVKAEQREKVYLKFKEIALQHFPDMTFSLGCELHVQTGYREHLADARCRMAETYAVLLEFSTKAELSDIEKSIRDVTGEGYYPIIAHAERCESLRAKPEYVLKLRDMGAMIQINADTILEGMFSARKKFARELLKQDAVDYIASDAHDMTDRPVRLAAAIEEIKKRYGADTAERLFGINQEEDFG